MSISQTDLFVNTETFVAKYILVCPERGQQINYRSLNCHLEEINSPPLVVHIPLCLRSNLNKEKYVYMV